MNTLGENIQKIREDAGLTPLEFADRCNLRSRKYLTGDRTSAPYEDGSDTPSPEEIVTIAKEMKCDVMDIFKGTVFTERLYMECLFIIRFENIESRLKNIEGRTNER